MRIHFQRRTRIKARAGRSLQIRLEIRAELSKGQLIAERHSSRCKQTLSFTKLNKLTQTRLKSNTNARTNKRRIITGQRARISLDFHSDRQRPQTDRRADGQAEIGQRRHSRDSVAHKIYVVSCEITAVECSAQSDNLIELTFHLEASVRLFVANSRSHWLGSTFGGAQLAPATNQAKFHSIKGNDHTNQRRDEETNKQTLEPTASIPSSKKESQPNFKFQTQIQSSIHPNGNCWPCNLIATEARP